MYRNLEHIQAPDENQLKKTLLIIYGILKEEKCLKYNK